jgi:hypothetical protein
VLVAFASFTFTMAYHALALSRVISVRLLSVAHFLDGLAYQVADGDGRFCIGWAFNYRDVLVAVDLDVAVS